jgi:LysM repeat protein
MKSLFYIGAFFSTFSVHSFVEKVISKEEYVKKWRQVAVSQMIEHNVPASITMAQGILESGNGNSDLAKKGNNHFGIKCNDWAGEKMYKNDDLKNECFRVYTSAEESFIDHSLFLKGKSRYSKLFYLEISDYKGWAKGLKDAGYATNPKYASLLIKIIETLKLSELDVLGNSSNNSTGKITPINKEKVSVSRTVLIHENNVKYIIAKKGDTFCRIANEFHLGLWQLYKYNDFGLKKDVLVEGDVVYLQHKRRKSKTNETIFKVNKSTNLVQISQETAIKISSLKKNNERFSLNDKIEKGDIIKLK